MRCSISFSRSFDRCVLFALQRLTFDFELNDFAFELINFLRQRIDFNAQARSCFVDQIDRLVGKKTVSDIAIR